MEFTKAEFTTRARVVDLLGREQIADAPTAMGELFKNAIDAGASGVRVDYWPESKCLSLSDDGIGMRTKEDLLAKWFVLATESKRGQRGLDEGWLRGATLEQRTRIPTRPFGKKGIGRLAIALLGSATLVWTRWKSGDVMQRSLLLVPWSIFRHPLLTLDQIDIPLVTLDRTATKQDAENLIDRALAWVKSSRDYQNEVPSEVDETVMADMNLNLRASLGAAIEFSYEPGTQFIVLNTDEITHSHFKGWAENSAQFEDNSKELDAEAIKAYVAFCNPFQPPKLKVSLFVNGKENRLNRLRYWNREDFTKADHHIVVEIDESGFGKGTIRIGQETHDYEANLGSLPTSAKQPGKLRVEMGCVEGSEANTTLEKEQFDDFAKRLNLFGGFGVYMDDIRVCPYGREDADFLGFEKRRSLNAGRYYFSHRWMFGGLFLDSSGNADGKDMLLEKAGREGFVQNSSFRGLVLRLRALFLDLADTHFGSKAPDRPNRALRDRRVAEREQKRRAREARETADREAFIKQLESAPAAMDNRMEGFRQAVQQLSAAQPDMFRPFEQRLDELRAKFDNLWRDLPSEKTPGFDLDESQAETMDVVFAKREAYDLEATRLISNAAATGPSIVLAGAKPAPPLDVNHLLTEATTAAQSVLPAIGALEEAIQMRPTQDVAAVEALTNLWLQNEPAAAMELVRARGVRLFQEDRLPFYGKIRRQLDLMAKGNSDWLEADDLREELHISKKRERDLLELAQLGLAMESTDHDYHSMMAKAMEALSVIEKSANKPPDKAQLRLLKDTLGHLDSQLQNWDPLVRRVRGQITQITGGEIWQFILHAFDSQRREGLGFERTEAFDAQVFPSTKRAVFLGALHNLIMNAGYWALKAGKPAKVRFSLGFGGIIISDSGHGIAERDRERLFDPGFSRRPMGRGLGLYIARSCLRSFGYD